MSARPRLSTEHRRTPRPVDDAARARVTENLTLLARFMDEVFANPALAEEVPDGATLVLFDATAETLDRAKADAADAMERAGQTVYRRSV